MRTVSKEELSDILKKHKMWLNGEVGGIRADLSGADLSGADLHWASLNKADLYAVNLRRADLHVANLLGADLRLADLYEANLLGADLSWADLSGAILYKADLRGAELSKADLSGADLSGADLYLADLHGAKNLNFPIACPEKGMFTAFKKARGYIIELEIPDDALRSSSTTRKCRCSKAKVVSITNLDGTPSDIKSVASCHDSEFIYNLGETVEVPNFDTNRWNECAPGIHFFITRQEAIDYAL